MSIDLTNINFENLEPVIQSLSTLPQLIDLKINLSSQQEASLILENLPNLQYLNGKTTKDENHYVDIEDQDVEEISLTLEVNKFNEVHKKISELLKNLNNEAKKRFHDDFFLILKEEIANINFAVENTIPNYIYATKVLSSKIKIYKYFYDTLTSTGIPISNDSYSFALLKDLNEKIKYNSDLMADIMFKLHPKINERTESLRRQLEEAMKGAQIVDEEIKNFEEKIELSNKERNFVIQQSQEEKNELLEKIKALEKENKLLTERMIIHSKMLIEDNEKNPLGGTKNQPPPRKLSEINPNIQLNKSQSIERIDNNNAEFNKSKYAQMNNSQVVISSRVLTIKMLKDFINEIFSSKAEFDIKCRENKMPRETMEQHMYSYLNQKYGLKVNFLIRI